MSETVYRVMKHYNKMKHSMPLIYVKLYTSRELDQSPKFQRYFERC